MKNFILFISFLFAVHPALAQKNKIVGKWIIVNEARRDTIDMELTKEPWDDYNKNKKVLDTRYIDKREDIVINQRKWILVIKKDNDNFRGKVGNNLNKTIMYDQENQNYWTLTNDAKGNENKLILMLKQNNNTLLVIDEQRNYIVSEFKRAK